MEVGADLDIADIEHLLLREMQPYASQSWSWNYDDEGVATADGERGDQTPRWSYTYLFNRGAFEWVVAGRHSTGGLPEFEYALIDAVDRLLNAARVLELRAPLFVSVDLLRVKGLKPYHVEHGREVPFAGVPIKKDHLNPPPAVFASLDEPTHTAVRPILDRIWQAAGYKQCLRYDRGGNFVG